MNMNVVLVMLFDGTMLFNNYVLPNWVVVLNLNYSMQSKYTGVKWI